ncbi:MAG: NAD(P)H-dependent oxidoreductase [Acidimicrobiales bacterium]
MAPRRVLLVDASGVAPSGDRAALDREIADMAHAALVGAGHRVDRLVLADEAFQPAMSRAEREAYHSDTPIISDDVARYADLIRSVDEIVFVYRSVWFAPPAALKGLLDRTLVPGVGFRFSERSGKVRPGLTNIRRITAITTHGRSRREVRAAGDGGRLYLLRALRTIVHPLARRRFVAAYSIGTQDRSRQLLRRVERALGGAR